VVPKCPNKKGGGGVKEKLNCKRMVSLSSHENQADDVVIIHLNERQQTVYPQEASET
jgi:hypothetical protein